MFFWFAALSFALVLLVFDTPALDYRLIMFGSLVPWVDAIWGPPWVMHSVFFPVAVMVVVMLAGWGRRLVQRRWLGLPIGLFMHLVLAADWTDQDLFWWPALGLDVDGAEPHRADWGLGLVLEVIGIAVAVWLWRYVGLADADRRRTFIRSGAIDRTLWRG